MNEHISKYSNTFYIFKVVNPPNLNNLYAILTRLLLLKSVKTQVVIKKSSNPRQ